MKAVFWGCALGITAMLPAQAGSFDTCVAATQVLSGRVARLEVNGALILDDGRAVMLEGIRLPKGAEDHASDVIAHQAVSMLSNLARDRTITIGLRSPTEDRYARLRAQILTGAGQEPWLQRALLEQGLARVAPMPARGECTDKFYAAEREARLARHGLWALSAYAVRSSDHVPAGDAGTFQIVQGRVLTADVKEGRAYLDFGLDWRTDFTVTVSAEDLPAFRSANVDPRGFAGKLVRVRGIVDQRSGPEIEIATPLAIEVLP
jgi:endonuclease YncB( thermonuclease family)